MTPAPKPGADWSGCWLQSANLADANVTAAEFGDATLTSANLNGTDLSSADLTGVISGSVTGTAVRPANWGLSDGYLIGPSANLQQANLTGVNLARADLQSTDFGGARTPIPGAHAVALAAARHVRLSLQGPGITGVTAACGWNYAHGYSRAPSRFQPGSEPGPAPSTP